jgi:hypothetical protein
VLDLENWLTREVDGPNGARVPRLSDREGRPRTFDELLEQVRMWSDNPGTAPFGNSHQVGTCRMLSRRLMKLLYESRGVLRRQDREGNPLRVTARDTRAPRGDRPFLARRRAGVAAVRSGHDFPSVGR